MKGVKGIGNTIYEKLKSLVETGKIDAIENEKSNIIHELCNIYGVGPKKAVELSKVIKTIDELKTKQELLNDKQKIGLKYFEDLQKRIPRDEIDKFNIIIQGIIDKLNKKNKSIKAEIVGSYRRGAKSSGDIDIIFTSNTKQDFMVFLDEVNKSKLILEVLSKGPSKSLTIGTLGKSESIPRRIDFLYSPPDEYAFAILYFTGSKAFNVGMRQYAVNLGYSLNEHRLSGASEHVSFNSEKDIFDFLNLEYVDAVNRKNANCVKIKGEESDSNVILKKMNKKVVETEKISKEKVEKKKLKYKKDCSEFNPNYMEMDLDDLVNLIRKASDHYYNSSPIMTDNEFDRLREHLEKIAPDHPALTEIGAPILDDAKKVKLPNLMPSLDKVKIDTLAKWLNKYKGPYVISSKLDGVSALFVRKGKTTQLYTRGNGSIGQNISNLLKYIPNLMKISNKDCVVRGELIILNDDFKNYKDEFGTKKNPAKNARNTVSGLTTRKTVKKNVMKYVHFVAYEVIEPITSPLEQLELANSLGFEVVNYELKKNVDVEYCSKTLTDLRESSKYTIDGIIITDNKVYERDETTIPPPNPKHAVAFKMVLEDQKGESEVLKVVWNTSKHGILKPVVHIKPIMIGDVEVKKVNGQNAGYIEKNKIGKGAKLEIVRRGDVIPYIEKILKPSKSGDMPNVDYEWTATHVDAIVGKNVESQMRIALEFTNGLEIDGLGPGNIKKFSDAGFRTIPEIMYMTKEDLLELPGIKEKTASKIYSGFENHTKNKFRDIKIEKLMALSSEFGRGIAEKKIRQVIQKYPDILKDELTTEEMYSKIMSVPGFSVKHSTQFTEGLPKFKMFADEMKIDYMNHNIIESETDDESKHVLSKKLIVFTGGKVSEIVDYIAKSGGIIENLVTKETFALIAHDKNSESTKTKKAVKLGIPVYSIEEFKNLFLS